MILAIVGSAQLMVVLAATVVNIALPSAQAALHFSNDNCPQQGRVVRQIQMEESCNPSCSNSHKATGGPGSTRC
jgi:hypothetical protein